MNSTNKQEEGFFSTLGHDTLVNGQMKLLENPNIKKMWSAASQLFENGETLGDYFGVKSDSEEAAYTAAKAQYDAGQYKESLDIFRRICLTNHLNPRYFFGLASCFMMMEQYDPAIQSFSYCYMLMPNDPTPLFYVTICHVKIGNWEEADSGLALTQHTCSSDPKKYDDIISKLKPLKRSIDKRLSNAM